MARDALIGQCKTLDGDGCRDDSHRTYVHCADDEEDRYRPGTPVISFLSSPSPLPRPFARSLL
jgi:hypothetical protein